MYEDRIEHIRVINEDSACPVGTILTARVKKMLPSSNACFVDVGTGTDHFLAIPAIPGNIVYTDNLKHKQLKCEDQILVRISSERIKSKPPTADTCISLGGRYCVLENGKGISYSKKISEADRKRFDFDARFAEVLKNCHCIIRTQAGSLENLQVLYDEIFSLYEKYEKIVKEASTVKLYTQLYKPAGILESTVTDWLKFNIDEIITDEPSCFDKLKSFAGADFADKIRFYDDDALELVKLYRLESLTDEITGPKVFLKSGGFLVVEQGETLTAIDVNSGHAIKGEKEDTVFKLNLEAAEEIGRILKNRNLSGMILVDFINMKDPAHEKALVEKMKEILSTDDVRARFVDMTGLGLMEITRQRVNMTFREQWRS